jgi:dUTP pyrophosphatase
MKIKIKTDNEQLPQYATEGSSGVDLISTIDTIIQPGKTSLISTGIYVEIPENYELQIRSRSGLALKLGVIVANSPGTIDEDYRGEIGVILLNTTEFPCYISKGMKVAQAILTPVIKIEWEKVEKLSKTTRNTGGFGSTGII